MIYLLKIINYHHLIEDGANEKRQEPKCKGPNDHRRWLLLLQKSCLASLFYILH